MAAQKPRVLPAVNPSFGLQAWYRAKLLDMVDAMHKSVTYWVLSKYRNNEPIIAQDAQPNAELNKIIRALTKRWRGAFAQGAEDLGSYFAQAVNKRSDAQLRAILKKAGISVEFKMTKAQRDVLNATVNENVALIKSIPSQYLTQVEGSVMRSVQVGRDVGGLAKELEQHYGVTKRRAQLISRDQNNKATAVLQRARQTELGITQAIWMHSHAGKRPRPTHVANNGKPYDIATGWYDPDADEYVWPGTLINCRCTSRPIIPGNL